MDIPRTHTKTPLVKRALAWLLSAGLVALAAYYYWMTYRVGFSVDAEKIRVATVQQGTFTVSVKGTGTLVPVTIKWLAAEGEATVIRRVVKPGHHVKQGDLMVELANPQLEQQLVELEWEIAALTEETKAANVEQETQLLAHQTQVLNTQLDYERSLLEQQAQEKLIKTGAVSVLDYQRTRLETTQYLQRWNSNKKQLTKMQENSQVQKKARQARIQLLDNRLRRMQQRVDNLQVRATMDAIVLELPIEAGQRIQAGTSIAKLAQQKNLYAELDIPEMQIRNVAHGQFVTIDTRNSTITGQVSRIDPSVNNGMVTVDVTFTQPLPNDARPDLSVDGEIRITQIADTLFVSRPLYSQSNSQAALYKLTGDGRFAERIPVTLGAASPNQIEILHGLNYSDQIIVSDPTLFNHERTFRID